MVHFVAYLSCCIHASFFLLTLYKGGNFPERSWLLISQIMNASKHYSINVFNLEDFPVAFPPPLR